MNVLHILYPLKDGIELLLSSDVNEREMAKKLLRYGSNSGRSWIGNTGRFSSTFFGLNNLLSVLTMAKSRSVQIQLLRDICATLKLPDSDYIIRFRIPNQRPASSRPQKYRPTDFQSSWAYTSIKTEISESLNGGMKRKWQEHEQYDIGNICLLKIPPNESWTCLATQGATFNSPRPFDKNSLSDSLDEFEPEFNFCEYLQDTPGADHQVLFDFAFGDHRDVAVYKRQTSQLSSREDLFRDLTVPLHLVQSLLDADLLKLDVLVERIIGHFSAEQPVHGDSLLALGYVIDYYKHYLPQATISIGVIQNPVSTWRWTGSVVSQLDCLSPLAEQQIDLGEMPVSIYPGLLAREAAFAAILQFESGTIDVGVSDLQAVLAMSSGNSLFIAEELLRDPSSPGDVSACAISHAIGNIGKAGIALLVSPSEVEIREHDLDLWHVVNHHPFDGKMAGGSFEGTSIHLSFTDWEGPVSLDSSGYQGKEAYFVEAVVSVKDRGDWVGDLDILKGLKYLKTMLAGPSEKTCSHDPQFAAAGVEMTSIDCWEEILNPPDGFLVLRSAPRSPRERGYWQWMVRLAAVAIASSRNYKCICLPTEAVFCWTCLVGRIRADDSRRVLFIC